MAVNSRGFGCFEDFRAMQVKGGRLSFKLSVKPDPRCQFGLSTLASFTMASRMKNMESKSVNGVNIIFSKSLLENTFPTVLIANIPAIDQRIIFNAVLLKEIFNRPA